jgi:hypothetical protein
MPPLQHAREEVSTAPRSRMPESVDPAPATGEHHSTMSSRETAAVAANQELSIEEAPAPAIVARGRAR